MIPQPNYEELKQLYYKFQNNLPKTEFSRWLEEFRYTTNLLEFAKKANLKNDVVEFSKARDIAIKNLKKFGLKS